MEAPEKIFLLKNRLGVILSSFCVDPDKELDNIEYIRKDVFIKKAEKWFKSHGSFTIGFDGATFGDFLNFINK